MVMSQEESQAMPATREFLAVLVTGELFALFVTATLWLLMGDSVLGVFAGIFGALATVTVAVRWKAGHLQSASSRLGCY